MHLRCCGPTYFHLVAKIAPIRSLATFRLRFLLLDGLIAGRINYLLLVDRHLAPTMLARMMSRYLLLLSITTGLSCLENLGRRSFQINGLGVVAFVQPYMIGMSFYLRRRRPLSG